jgi:uncharacterized protein (TIGR00661 family)
LNTKPTILVCPLDWGIGHATRCVPIINELLENKVNVILGASGRSLDFLKQEFPGLQRIHFPGYVVSYPSKGSMALSMATQAPVILQGIKKENRLLKEIIRKHNINGIISDNRYGLYTSDIPSVFITHQVFIQAPSFMSFLNPVLLRMNLRFIKKYDECWVPDFEGENNLSGDLSHKKPLPPNVHFIGPLSRFTFTNAQPGSEYKYKFLVMVSGPEPQRSILEKALLIQLSTLQFKSAMVCGKPEVFEHKSINDHIDVYSHLQTWKLKELILQSEIIISRPGYSTIMDLVALNKKAIFIPTPGQTEQIYLSYYFKERKLYYAMDQKNINLQEAMEHIQDIKGIQYDFDAAKLKLRISKFLDRIN